MLLLLYAGPAAARFPRIILDSLVCLVFYMTLIDFHIFIVFSNLFIDFLNIFKDIHYLIKCVCYLPAYVGFMVTKTAQEGLRGRVGVPSKAKRERPACREEGEKREKEGGKRV